MYPPGNGGCGGNIQEKNSLLVHDPKLQTMIEKVELSYLKNIFKKSAQVCNFKAVILEIFKLACTNFVKLEQNINCFNT